MSNVAKLKKKALEFEQRKQFDKALVEYRKVLDELGDHVDEADVALFNRVGDLELRQGNISKAVDHYERAVDLYAEGGFFNNAIALCNKILRSAPGRTSIYYKLGMISAKKGFVNDAKHNFLEYADRMQQAGQLEEAFRALREFADLCPDQDDIRLMLADQLVRKDRKAEAIEQLQTLYDKLQSEGRSTEARATADRMRAIDPNIEPRATTVAATPKAGDLIFLDVSYEGGVRPPTTRKRTPPRPAPPAEPSALEPLPAAAIDTEPALGSAIDAMHAVELSEQNVPELDLPMLDVDLDEQASSLPGLVHGASFDTAGGHRSEFGADSVAGFERTMLDDDAPSDRLQLDEIQPLDGLEPTALVDDDPDTLTLDGSGITSPGLALDNPLGIEAELPMLDVAEDGPDVGPSLTFIDAEAEAPSPLIEMPADEPPVTLEQDLRAELADEAEAIPIEIQQEQAALLAVDATDTGEGSSGAEVDAVARRVDELRATVGREPEKWLAHRQLGEALVEAGDRDGGLACLERAMAGFEREGDFRAARGITDDILRLEPNSVVHHQKRVEYAFRAADRGQLVESYLELADCLFRSGEVDKSRAVYQRVLELSPDHKRALVALGEVAVPDTTPTATPAIESSGEPAATPPPVGDEAPDEATFVTPRAASAPERDRAPDDDFVNLSDWLREEETPRSTRMVVDVAQPETDEQVDFEEMLSMFKAGVAANMEETDYESHYDLGVAYKEMGLLDEAIAEFQKALRGTEHRIRTYEALGQCFVEKKQYQIAITILSQALQDRSQTDDMLVGVLYLLGIASEALGRWQDAVQYYERVFALDIQFRDVSARLATLERQAR
jgi:tetratricopeptide (TPR) repeat protein